MSWLRPLAPPIVGKFEKVYGSGVVANVYLLLVVYTRFIRIHKLNYGAFDNTYTYVFIFKYLQAYIL